MNYRETIKLDIYETEVVVHIVDDVPKKIEQLGSSASHQVAALVFDRDDLSTMDMVLPYKASPGLISHESLHVIYNVIDKIDHRFILHDETMTWLLEYIVDRVHEIEKKRLAKKRRLAKAKARK